MSDRVKRVLDALALRTPDMVPYVYSFIAKDIREALLGQKLEYAYNPGEADFGPVGRPGEETRIEPCEVIDERVARLLGLDAIGIQYFPPWYVDTKTGDDGTVYIAAGLLTTREDLKKIRLPDPDDDRAYRLAREFVKRYKGEYALFCRLRLGISSTLNSMGIEGFSYGIADDPDFVKEVISMYADWTARVARNVTEIGVDYLWCFDDMAFNTATMFSAAVWDEFFLPCIKKSTDTFTVPWIFHSDGNLLPLMDRVLALGMNGLHPLEPGAMDLELLKREYGRKICLVGNIDISYTLSKGTEEEVDQEVKDRIELLGPGGGYIISDSNSVPSYCKPANIRAMARAVEKYRRIYGPGEKGAS